jgi:hypothetical protein
MYNIYENFNKFLYILTLFSDLSLGEINNNIKQRTELSDNQKSMLHLPGVCMITLNIVRGDIFMQPVPLQTLTNGCEFSRSVPYTMTICKLYRGEQAVILVKKITGH